MKRASNRSNLYQRARDAESIGDFGEARELYKKVPRSEPKYRDALDRLSQIELRSGRVEQLEDILLTLVGMASNDASLRIRLGNARVQLGRQREALQDYVVALELDSNSHDALLNIGMLLQQGGLFESAIRSYERALDSKPGLVRAHLGLSEILAIQGDPDRATIHRECAAYLRGTGGGEVTWESLAPVVRDLRHHGRLPMAVSCLHAALARDPQNYDIWLQLWDVLRCLGRSSGAIVAARQAARLAPTSVVAHASLAAALADCRQLGEALAAARQAIEIDSTFSDAYYQEARALLGLGELELAASRFRRAIELDAQHHAAHSGLVFTMQYMPGLTQTVLSHEARNWARQYAPRAETSVVFANAPAPERRLRVGYVSEDFRRHPIANFLLPLLAHHNRDQVEICCYSSVRQPDSITDRVRQLADHYREVVSINDSQLADMIRQDGIDVLVDLALHSGDHRLRTFALRPAPVQICYLGYLGTTGLDTVQYRITAPDLDDATTEAAAAYVEAPLKLPQCYWCYDPLELDGSSRLEPGELPPTTTAGHVTFGSQNSFHKVSTQTLSLWARVLNASANSRLLMHAPVEARPRVLRFFEEANVSATRIEFVATSPRHEYLGRFRSIDVCLDTLPFNGATTTLDGIWMGTPTLTIVGPTAAGRAGKHICNNLGLTELVANTSDEFVLKAVELTSDLVRLTELRRGLRARLTQSPLMDVQRFMVQLESVYREAWRNWCNDSEAHTG